LRVAEVPHLRLFKNAQQKVHRPVRGCFPGRGDIASQDPELFAPQAFLAQTGWDRTTLRPSKNKLIIARREPATPFLTFKGIVQN
jgi:hypothetical protein